VDGEQTTQTAEATQATGTTQASGSHGAVPGGSRQQFAAIPDLGPGKENESQWVMYLQELLNFYYQMQVVNQDGHFDHQTENAVSHFRDFMNLGAGSEVTREVWQALGAEAPGGNDTSHSSSSSSGGASGSGGSVEERDHHVQIVELQGEATWAASAAIVLNAKAGGSYNTETLCQRVNATTSDRKGWQDLVNLASDLGMRLIPCQGGTAAGWSNALQDTPLCMPNPGDEYNIIVIAGVKADGHLHVLDPKYNFDNWMTWSDFASHYSINDGYNAELLGV
jgi:peptidoglycan hydrolase-like protein with peptidoglycan-binding domain